MPACFRPPVTRHFAPSAERKRQQFAASDQCPAASGTLTSANGLCGGRVGNSLGGWNVGMYPKASYTHGRGVDAGIRLDFVALGPDRPFVTVVRLYPQENEYLGVSRRWRRRSHTAGTRVLART